MGIVGKQLVKLKKKKFNQCVLAKNHFHFKIKNKFLLFILFEFKTMIISVPMLAGIIPWVFAWHTFDTSNVSVYFLILSEASGTLSPLTSHPVGGGHVCQSSTEKLWRSNQNPATGRWSPSRHNWGLQALWNKAMSCLNPLIANVNS